jgi:hypothetical protein
MGENEVGLPCDGNSQAVHFGGVNEGGVVWIPCAGGFVISAVIGVFEIDKDWSGEVGPPYERTLAFPGQKR